tara:strand:+ start:30754 stop:31905 length:1152 start_codon:yes stop_codon:yes gene_type:complete
MQIAFCLYKYFPYGGIQRDLMKLVRECLARGHTVRVYAGEWNAPPPEARMELVMVPAAGLRNHTRYARFARWVAQHARAHPVDLLVGMNKMPGLDVYYAGDSCYAEKARTQRGALYRLLPRYRHFAHFEHEVFRADVATEILTIADHQQPTFVKHYATPAERFHPLPPGIDRDRAVAPAGSDDAAYRRELGLGEGGRVLLFVGSGFVKKGLDRALTALAALPEPLASSTAMLVVGSDNPARFRRMAARLGVAARVHFFSGRDDIPRLLHLADGLVLPAYDETAGMVILEAMIAGLPALVTANCGYAPYLAEADAGLVSAEPFDQRTFNAELAELLASDQREGWRANGRAFGANPQIYRLAEVAVDYLERFARAVPSPDRQQPA